MGIGDGFLSGFQIRLTGRCWCRHGSTDLIIWGVLMIWCLATSGEGFVASPSLSRTQQPLRWRRGFARGFSDLRTFRFGVAEIATGLRSNLKNVGHRRMQIMLIGACGCTVVHVVRLFVILDLVLPGWDGMGGRMLQGSAPSSIRLLSAAGRRLRLLWRVKNRKTAEVLACLYSAQCTSLGNWHGLGSGAGRQG